MSEKVDGVTNDQIMQLIKTIEKDQLVHIPFVVIAGSRGQGVANDNSDYDIRFVYLETFERRNLVLTQKEPDEAGTMKVVLDNRAQTIDKNTIGTLIPSGMDVSGMSLRKLLLSSYEGSSETFFLLNSQEQVFMGTQFNTAYNDIKNTVFHHGKAARSLIKSAKCFADNVAKDSVGPLGPRTIKDSMRALTYLRSALVCMGRCYPDTDLDHRYRFLLDTVNAHINSLKLAYLHRPTDLAHSQIQNKYGNWSLLKRLIEDFHEIYTPEAIMNVAEAENVQGQYLDQLSHTTYTRHQARFGDLER